LYEELEQFSLGSTWLSLQCYKNQVFKKKEKIELIVVVSIATMGGNPKPKEPE